MLRQSSVIYSSWGEAAGRDLPQEGVFKCHGSLFRDPGFFSESSGLEFSSDFLALCLDGLGLSGLLSCLSLSWSRAPPLTPHTYGTFVTLCKPTFILLIISLQTLLILSPPPCLLSPFPDLGRCHSY